MPIRAVVFDVGETLVDETRLWGEWADWLGISRLTMFAVLGSVIERGEDHRRTFAILRPGMDFAAEDARRRVAGKGWRITREDLFADVVPCLQILGAADIQIGVAGNMPAEAESSIRSLGLPIDWLASSATWGVEKPDSGFFKRIVEITGLEPNEIAYVGDRIDNDVIPAADAGMIAVFIRRGPWATVQSRRRDAGRAAFVLDSFQELPARLGIPSFS